MGARGGLKGRVNRREPRMPLVYLDVAPKTGMPVLGEANEGTLAEKIIKKKEINTIAYTFP